MIEVNTPADAVFLDTTLTLPVAARRRMYVGLDLPRRGVDARVKNGWGPPTWVMEAVFGIPHEDVTRRIQLAKTLIWPGEQPMNDYALEAVAEDVSGRPLYLVARDSSVDRRLSTSNQLEVRFRNQAGVVYAYVGARS